MATIVGALFGKIIDKGGDIIDKKITIEGKKDLEEIKGKWKRAEHILDNERQDSHEHHLELMEDKKNEQEYRMDKLSKDHEINLLRQNAENKKLEEEMRIKSEDHHEKNKREMEKISKEFELKMTYAKADIEKTERELNIKEKTENHRNEAEILKINKDNEKAIAEMNADMEK